MQIVVEKDESQTSKPLSFDGQSDKGSNTQRLSIGTAVTKGKVLDQMYGGNRGEKDPLFQEVPTSKRRTIRQVFLLLIAILFIPAISILQEYFREIEQPLIIKMQEKFADS